MTDGISVNKNKIRFSFPGASTSMQLWVLPATKVTWERIAVTNLKSLGNGFFELTLLPTQCNTMGTLCLYGSFKKSASETLEMRKWVEVVAYDPYNSVNLGLSGIGAATGGDGGVMVFEDTVAAAALDSVTLTIGADNPFYFDGCIAVIMEATGPRLCRWVYSYDVATKKLFIQKGESGSPWPKLPTVGAKIKILPFPFRGE